MKLENFTDLQTWTVEQWGDADYACNTYAAGGRTIDGGVGSKNPFKSNFISGFKLTQQEKQDLLEFLRSLRDESFINNPAQANPQVQ